MLHFATTLLNWLVIHWATVSAIVGGGAGLSVALQWVLHKLGIDSKKLAYTLIHLLSMATALSAFYLDNTSVLPAYAGLVIAAQTVHRFVVSPYYNKYVLPYLTFLSENQPKSQGQEAQPAIPSQEQPAPSFVS